MAYREFQLSCSFCEKNQKQVKKLIAGVTEPRAFICDSCISRAHAAPAESGPCGFCGQHHDQVAALASAGNTRICPECLGRCDALLIEAYGPG